jgi:hypothetical protein
MVDLINYKVCSTEKCSVFHNNPVGDYLKKRNEQSVKALWTSFLVQYDLKLCYTYAFGWGLFKKSESYPENRKLWLSDLKYKHSRFFDLEQSLHSCVTFYSYTKPAKVARENHWYNKAIFREMREILESEIKD